jgi:Ca2+-binding RTX toxin-like protein
VGGKGNDQIKGGKHKDRLFARDGLRDTVSGGAGKDTGKVDAIDVVRKVEKGVPQKKKGKGGRR